MSESNQVLTLLISTAASIFAMVSVVVMLVKMSRNGGHEKTSQFPSVLTDGERNAIYTTSTTVAQLATVQTQGMQIALNQERILALLSERFVDHASGVTERFRELDKSLEDGLKELKKS